MVLNMKSISRRGFIAGTVAMLPLVGLKSVAEAKLVLEDKLIEAKAFYHFENIDWYLARVQGEVDIKDKAILLNGEVFDTDGFTTSIPGTAIVLDNKTKKVIGFQVMQDDQYILHIKGNTVTASRYGLKVFNSLTGYLKS